MQRSTASPLFRRKDFHSKRKMPLSSELPPGREARAQPPAGAPMGGGGGGDSGDGRRAADNLGRGEGMGLTQVRGWRPFLEREISFVKICLWVLL